MAQDLMAQDLKVSLGSLQASSQTKHIEQVARSLEVSYEKAAELVKKADEMEEIGCVAVDEQGNVIPRRRVVITDMLGISTK